MGTKPTSAICEECEGRGYFRCDCWPADCICDEGDYSCTECGGDGIIDTSYDYDDTEPNDGD